VKSGFIFPILLSWRTRQGFMAHQEHPIYEFHW
jgi:hypothetical protein